MEERGQKIFYFFLGVFFAAFVGGIFYWYFYNPQLGGVVDSVKNAVEKTPIGGILDKVVPAGKEDLIEVDSPLPNQEIESPLLVTGQARGYWFFEASFPVKLLDGNGKEIAVKPAEAQEEWMTEEFVPFKSTLEFKIPGTDFGTLVLEKDNPSGLPEKADELRVPVRFKQSSEVGQETTKFKIYFSNSKLDSESVCVKVFPVAREIPKTQAVARAALEELLKGLTEKEKTDNYLTNINEGVKIQRLEIKDGVAKVDFNDKLEFQVGGSCRVAAISAQITETLKQFPTVKEAVISINGRTEDILQP
ncbi:MAG: GerMN domain-containing protein [Patescibacteria group bacterium]